MALKSPGVEVTVIDESFYTPAAPGTTPIIFVATAQDKSNASGTGTAQGTMAVNAGKVYAITSQRDLTDTFGTPVFYTDSNKNPIHAGELNEYGLQAAYSLLGASSKAYIARADVDLAQLKPASSAPVGAPFGGTFWVDTASSLFGVSEWNNDTKTFTDKKPLIIDSSNEVGTFLNGVPLSSFGSQGDYAMFITSANGVNNNLRNALFYKKSNNTWALVQDAFDGGKAVQISPHYEYPSFTVTGSVWVKTTSAAHGAKWAVKYFNGSTQSWGTVAAPIYNGTQAAIQALDAAHGGSAIPVGSVFIETDATTPVASFKLWRRNATGPMSITGAASTATSSGNTTFEIRATDATGAWASNKTIVIGPTNAATIASLVPAAVSAQGMPHVSATYNSATHQLTFIHALGGEIEFGNAPSLTTLGLTTSAGLYSAPASDEYDLRATNWAPLSYTAAKSAQSNPPADGKLWYNSNLDADIMIHDGTNWVGYKTETSPYFTNDTDPNGPIISALEPTTQSDKTALAIGDIWISTADISMYGKDIYVYNGSKWEMQDVADQSTPSGWLFADARWGTTSDATDAASITALLSSSALDSDAPDARLYPKGMKLWNLRRSGFNVKQYDTSTGNARWVTVSPNNEDGSGKFGAHAQRGYVVSKIKAMIDTSAAIRDTDTLVFNLIATPGYPEAIANMVAFNSDRGHTAFVVGDTPFRLKPTGTELTAWGTNAANAHDNGDDGLVTADEYLGMFYPSGYTTDNSGNNIVVPASHMMLRTIVQSDAKSYQWFAPAGTRRGGVDNATSVGYVDGEGEFKTVALYEGLRNVLQDPIVRINPIATLPGVGIVNMGQRTRAKDASAMDRINVVRLIAFLRRQLAILAKPYLFEPNDAQTRRELKAAADSLMLELVGQRALYDYIVVCDTTNNTPARIDRSELYMDIAIEPVKAVEFIYIPLRIKNTGEIAAGK